MTDGYNSRGEHTRRETGRDCIDQYLWDWSNDGIGCNDNPRVRDLSDEDLNRMREIIDKGRMVEGDLRREVNQNIRRLIDIGCYRGTRHRRGLPTRGQRTKTNARAKRGRKMAVSRKHSTTR